MPVSGRTYADKAGRGKKQHSPPLPCLSKQDHRKINALAGPIIIVFYRALVIFGQCGIIILRSGGIFVVVLLILRIGGVLVSVVLLFLRFCGIAVSIVLLFLRFRGIAVSIVLLFLALRSSSQPLGMPSSLSSEWHIQGVNLRF